MIAWLATLGPWAIANPKKVAITLAVALVGGFVLLSFHWKHQAEQASSVIAGQKEVIKSIDRHDAKEVQIQSEVERQSEAVRKLPDADKPIDPARRDQLRKSIECVRNHKPAASCKLPKPLPAG